MADVDMRDRPFPPMCYKHFVMFGGPGHTIDGVHADLMVQLETERDMLVEAIQAVILVKDPVEIRKSIFSALHRVAKSRAMYELKLAKGMSNAP
jgi:hypothetical protein